MNATTVFIFLGMLLIASALVEASVLQKGTNAILGNASQIASALGPASGPQNLTHAIGGNASQIVPALDPASVPQDFINAIGYILRIKLVYYV